MPNKPFSLLTELAEPPAIDDFMAWTDKSDTTESADGTSKRNKAQYALGSQVNAQTGTTYTYLTTDFRKLVTHTNASAIAGTLPQAGASFPANWFMFVQNRGAGVLTITPTTSTIDGAATLVLNQNEGALIVSDGTNYFSMRGKATGGVGGVGDVVGPATSTDNAVVRYDGTTGKLGQNSVVIITDAGALTVPEIAAPSTPAAGTIHIYAKSDGKLYIKDDAGLETDITSTGAADIAPLVIEDANTVSQRNSTNVQNLSVYGSFVSDTNYKRIRVGWTGSGAEIFSEAQTQTASNLQFKVGSGTVLNMGAASLVPTADITFVLGSGSFYFQEIYNRDWITRSGGMLRFVSGARLKAPADGVLNWTDDSGNSGSGTIRFDPRTPSTITSDEDNYSVPVTGYFIRLATDASRTLTGLTFGGGGVGNGQVHLLVNVGSNDLVLAHQNASSTAGNRFLNSTGADITLSANQAADLIYDGTTQRWRVFKRN